MIRTYRWGWLVWFAAAAAFSEARADPSDAVATEITRLENLFSQSFVTGDPRVAERLLSEDFIGFGPTGKRLDKAAVLAEVRQEPHETSAKITSIVIRRHGDTVIALGTEEDTNPGSGAVVRREWLDTWRRTPGGWRLVAEAEVEPKP